MKRIFCLLLLLMLTTPSIVSAQGGFPPMPGPPPLTLPNCPTQLMGSANDIFYYATSSCTAGSITGYGQSNTDFSNPNILSCCVSNACKTGCTVLPTVIFSNKKTVSPLACSLPESTAPELDAKLAAIIAESEARVIYLDKLFASGDVEGNDDGKSHKGRIRKWRNYLNNKLIPYLKNSADPVKSKIDHYCLDVLPMASEHQEKWTKATLKVANGRTQVIQDVQQPTLPGEDTVIFVPKSGVSVGLTRYCSVTVSDLPGGTQELFFKTFIVNTPQGNFQIGIQVQKPGAGKVIDSGELQDRHGYGHKIAATSDPGTPEEATRPYLCSSYLDLTIEE